MKEYIKLIKCRIKEKPQNRHFIKSNTNIEIHFYVEICSIKIEMFIIVTRLTQNLTNNIMLANQSRHIPTLKKRQKPGKQIERNKNINSAKEWSQMINLRNGNNRTTTTTTNINTLKMTKSNTNHLTISKRCKNH